MDKRTFFDNLHLTLADKFSTDKSSIQYIRSFFIGKGKTREDMIDLLEEKIKNLYSEMDKTHKEYIKTSIKEQIEIRNKRILFIESLKDADFLEITKITEFDSKS